MDMLNLKDKVNHTDGDIPLNSQTTFVYAIFLVLALLAGSIGNVLVICVICITKELRKVVNVFILNLALADVLISCFVDSFSLVGAYFGEKYFDERHGLCVFIASLCLTSCYCSLLSIGAITVERYVHICHFGLYQRIYTRQNVAFMCIGLWTVSGLLELPNFVGWGGHRFIRSAHGCYFDWEDYSYACFFVLVGVLVPLCIITFCYVRIYTFVRTNRRRVQDIKLSIEERRRQAREKRQSIALARTLFIIFLTFVICWTPFAVLMVADQFRTFPYQAYMFAVAVAHSNSSWNPLVYGISNKTFRAGYKRLFQLHRCSPIPVNVLNTVTEGPANHTIRGDSVAAERGTLRGGNHSVEINASF